MIIILLLAKEYTQHLTQTREDGSFKNRSSRVLSNCVLQSEVPLGDFGRVSCHMISAVVYLRGQ